MRTKKQQRIDTKHHHASMSEHRPNAKAKADFKRPAYQARRFIAEQGQQMEHVSVEEYLAKKYNIKGEIPGGQK